METDDSATYAAKGLWNHLPGQMTGLRLQDPDLDRHTLDVVVGMLEAAAGELHVHHDAPEFRHSGFFGRLAKAEHEGRCWGADTCLRLVMMLRDPFQ